MFCSFRFIIKSFLPAQHVAIMSHTFPRLCHTHLCFHLVRFSGSSVIILVCRDCHHVVLLHLNTLCMEKITAFSLSSHHPMAHHILFCHLSKGQCLLHPYLSGHRTRSYLVLDPRLLFLSFQSRKNFVIFFLFPILEFFQGLLCPRPVFASKGKDGIHMVHQTPSFYPPRNVLALVYRPSKKPSLSTAIFLPQRRTFSLDDSSYSLVS